MVMVAGKKVRTQEEVSDLEKKRYFPGWGLPLPDGRLPPASNSWHTLLLWKYEHLHDQLSQNPRERPGEVNNDYKHPHQSIGNTSYLRRICGTLMLYGSQHWPRSAKVSS